MLVRKEFNLDGTWMHMRFVNKGYICEKFGRDEFGDQITLEHSRHALRKDANAWMDSRVRRN